MQAQGSSKAHQVTPNRGGWFDVLSSRSGITYRVTPWATGLWADCTCESFKHRSRCSHVEAVRAFAREVNRELGASAPVLGPTSFRDDVRAALLVSSRRLLPVLQRLSSGGWPGVSEIERRQLTDALSDFEALCAPPRVLPFTLPARTPAAPSAVAPTTQPGPALTEAPRSVRPGPGAEHVHESRPDQTCFCAEGREEL